MSKLGYGVMIGVAVTLALAGIVGFYWKLKTTEADWWVLGWLVGWMVLFWPILYYGVWRVYVNLKK